MHHSARAHLEISQVSMEFPTPTGSFVALDKAHLRIAQGEFISLIGHSGCGKSTLLNIVAGLMQPTSGGVILEGREVTAPGPDRAVVFQNHALFPWLSVYENVALAVKHVHKGRMGKAEMRDWVLENLRLVHMDHAMHKRPDEISGGMKQRVGIARALAMEPKVLLLDEPFGALDALTRAHLQDALMEIHQRLNNTILMITHDVDEAVLLSDRVVMMTNGPAATIGEVLAVDLPRPRARLMLADDPHYNHLRTEVLRFLHERHAKPDVPLSAPAGLQATPAHSVSRRTGQTKLRLGFVPLTDAAPLIMGVEEEIFRAHGLDVELSQETSWASIRDKVAVGMLDGAQMLAPMPLAARVGASGPRQALLVPRILSRGGNAITISQELVSELEAIDAQACVPGAMAPAALKTLIEQRRAAGKPRLTFGIVFPSSSHNYLLRHWVASAGIDPDRDLRLIVVPPPQMVRNLENGNVAGFCVGEPWNSLAVEKGIGQVIASSLDIWPGHVEKVLGMSEATVRSRPHAVQQLLQALDETGRWLERAENRPRVARTLGRSHYLDLPEDMLLPALEGGLQNSVAASSSPLLQFCSGAAARPDPDSGLWWLMQMYRWGQLDRPLALTTSCDCTFDASFHDGLFGSQSLDVGWPKAGPEFDPQRPLDYLYGLELGEKPSWVGTAIGMEAA